MQFGVIHSRESGLYNDLRITAAYQNFQESRNDRKSGNILIRRQFENVDAFSLNVDFDKKVSKRFATWKPKS